MTSTDLAAYMAHIGVRARAASAAMARAGVATKSDALLRLAALLRAGQAGLEEANARDVAAAQAQGLAAPLVIHRVYGARGWSQAITAACVLVGGLCLRTGVVTVNAELLARGPVPHRAISPEQTRQVGERGADPGNHGPVIPAGTKIPGEP